MLHRQPCHAQTLPLVAALALLMVTRLGQMAGTLASSLGMIAAAAGAILHPDPGHVLLQVVLLALFALAFAGARSLSQD